MKFARVSRVFRFITVLQADYDTQGQKIGQMLRKLSVYNATEPTSEEADEKPKTVSCG